MAPLAEADRPSIEGATSSEPSGGLNHPALEQEVAALEERLDALLRRNPTHRPNQRLLRHHEAEREHLLTFLTRPGVEATKPLWRRSRLYFRMAHLTSVSLKWRKTGYNLDL